MQTVHALGIAGTQSAGPDGRAIRRHGQAHACRPRRRRAGSTARCSQAAASPASSTCSRRPTAASAPPSRARTDRFNLDELSAGLGERFETMGIALKFYSCVGSNHTTLDAIRDIRQRRPFTLDELDRIVVHGSQVTVDHVGWPYRPEGPDLGAAQPAVLRRARCCSKATCSSISSRPEAVDDRRAHRAVAQGRGRARSRHHRARRSAFRHKVRVEVHFRDGYGRDRDARGAARQRAVVRDRGRDRREIPQAHARRDERGRNRLR